MNTLPESILIYGDWETREVHIDGKLLRPEMSQKICNHSPDGFNWGYGGSGPAQLSLAILLNYMDAKDAQAYYQNFKLKEVATWPQTVFQIRLNLRKSIEEIINANVV